MGLFSRRVIGGVAHENADALRGKDGFQPVHDGHGEAAETVVGNQADGAGQAGMQAFGKGIRAELQVLGHGQHAGAGIGSDGSGLVQRLGHGADRDTGGAGDIADGGGDAGRVNHLTAPDSRPEM